MFYITLSILNIINKVELHYNRLFIDFAKLDFEVQYFFAQNKCRPISSSYLFANFSRKSYINTKTSVEHIKVCAYFVLEFAQISYLTIANISVAGSLCRYHDQKFDCIRSKRKLCFYFAYNCPAIYHEKRTCKITPKQNENKVKIQCY